MNKLQNSWNAFSKDVAAEYLKTFGTPSLESKHILFEVLRDLSADKKLDVIDLGCGNANLAEYLTEQGLNFSYTGVDFSDVLVKAARDAFPTGTYVLDDVNLLRNVKGEFDVAIYSHVIEMLPSPESSLLSAKRFAKKIVIRFFEPPESDSDWTELLEMDVGEGAKVPYLRRRMSKDYYRLILAKMGCKAVDVYRDGFKDQIHVLHY